MSTLDHTPCAQLPSEQLDSPVLAAADLFDLNRADFVLPGAPFHAALLFTASEVRDARFYLESVNVHDDGAGKLVMYGSDGASLIRTTADANPSARRLPKEPVQVTLDPAGRRMLARAPNKYRVAVYGQIATLWKEENLAHISTERAGTIPLPLANFEAALVEKGEYCDGLLLHINAEYLKRLQNAVILPGSHARMGWAEFRSPVPGAASDNHAVMFRTQQGWRGAVMPLRVSNPAPHTPSPPIAQQEA